MDNLFTGGSGSPDVSGLFPSLKVLNPAYYQQKISDYQAQAAVAAAAGQMFTSPDQTTYPPLASPTLGGRVWAWVQANPVEALVLGALAAFGLSRL